ncbi:MAG: polyphosphate kinase 1 [Gemmatimonadota bacterium]
MARPAHARHCRLPAAMNTVARAVAIAARHDEFFNAELSLLAFQRRVLALAEDPATPLLERLRFLGIVTSNMDELYMVRMAELRRAARDTTYAATHDHHDGYSPVARLQAVEEEVTEILAAQSRCAAECLRAAAACGVQLLTWSALTDAEREALQAQYLAEIHPDLTPHAITLSPGVPLPHLPHLGLFIAIVYRAPGGERTHLAEHELPLDLARVMMVPGRPGAVIAIEEVLRANAHLLYPNAVVEAAYLFRVTRGGDLHLHDDHAHDLLVAVASATERRPHNPAVRVEVESSMPARIGALILDNLHRDALGREMEITVDSVQVIDGLLDLRCLQALPLPADPALQYPPLVMHRTVPDGTSMLDAIGTGDLLLHHPFESFDESVVRFFHDAAIDPTVTSIQATLYRVGTPSPIVEAMLQAARAGKRVFALVELQARFDEEHNVQWARALERAGGRVVYGLPGLKVHAKLALVERERDGVVTRVAHVGTGNYNPRSGRQYTDLSLFTADPELTAGVSELFRALAASTSAHEPLRGGLLSAPDHLLPALLQRIEREAAHARAGRAASITIKVNGLADREVVRALYAAAQAGVQVDLVVRGICTLRPGVPGLSDSIRVFSVVGQLLEHSRIYRFGNGGAPEYLIGSSDLRPRNLRRRVEVLVPVNEPAQQQRLDDLLSRYLEDATAWELDRHGAYHPRGGRTGAQVRCAADLPAPSAAAQV